jgi:hypothetical protein
MGKWKEGTPPVLTTPTFSRFPGIFFCKVYWEIEEKQVPRIAYLH